MKMFFAIENNMNGALVIKLFGARGAINSHFIFLKVNRNNPVSSQIIYYVMFYGTL